MSHATNTISVRSALELVAPPERRSVLAGLIDGDDDVVTVTELVDYVALENPPPGPAGRPPDERVRIALEHTHLPKLEHAGLVERDERSDAIRYYPNERVEKLHRFVTTELERGDGPGRESDPEPSE